MRFKKKIPMSFFRLLTMHSHQYGVSLIYFTPEDIKIKEKKIIGKMLLNDQLVEIESRVPDYIDVSPHFFNKKNSKKYKTEVNFLKKNSDLSIDRRQIIRKDRLQKVLLESNTFSHLSIPTFKIKEFDDFIKYINKYNKVIFKSTSGLQGKGVTVITKNNQDFIIGEQREDKVLNLNQLEEFFNEHIYEKNYIMQRYINSRSKTGDPIDCRIHLEKNDKGKWEVARKFIRVGIGQKVVSNISQGGCIADVKSYLKFTFGNEWEQIYRKITNIETKLPYFIEKHEKKKFMVMGFDVAIDLNGELYIFEVNSFPIIAPQRAQVARIRSGYYAFRIKSNINRNKTSSKDKTRKPKLNGDFYKKEYHKLINSTSWKISKPVRQVGHLIKKFKR